MSERERVALAFAGQVRKAMEAEGMTQGELARRLGVSAATISLILSGKRNLTVKTMVQVAGIFDLRVQVRLW